MGTVEPQVATNAETRSIDGFQLVIDALKLNGLDTIYALPGIPITDLTRRAQADGLRVLSFRHEQNAGYAASIAGFLTQKPGVCLTVSAPGFLNGLNNLLFGTIIGRFAAICERKRPSFSPKARCGPTTASVFASMLGMFTALRISPSSRAARMACAISMPTLSCASAVDAPRCGVRMRFGIRRSGESAGSGSVSKTSSAAPAR